MQIREIPRELIEKYSQSVPRYTSYPTAVEFSSDFGSNDWKNALKESEISSLSLYAHIPFCPKLCYFCACNKVITDDRSVAVSYINAVSKEVELISSLLPVNIPVEQIHWGGGSPNFLSPDLMKDLHMSVVSRFSNLTGDSEISVELDPRTTTSEQLEVLRESGFNRVSFGVQDFNPEVQETINRVQSYEETRTLADRSRILGFRGLNLDLIYGLPQQTLEGFSTTLEKVMEIRPDRIALYGYAHVTWLHKVQTGFRRFHLPTPEERVALFQLAVEKLLAAGYEHVGLDHFALPDDGLAIALRNGTLNRNFMGYTTHKGVALLGFGASSISSLPGAFAQNEKEPNLYKELIEAGKIPVVRGLKRSADDRLRGELIEQILCKGEIDFSSFEAEFGIDPRSDFPECFERLNEMISDGLLTLDENSLKLSELGRFFARNVASVFDAHLEKHRELSKRVFSQAL